MNKLIVSIALDYLGKLAASAGTVLAANDYIKTEQIPELQHMAVVAGGLAVTVITKWIAARHNVKPRTADPLPEFTPRPNTRDRPEKLIS